MYNVIRRESDDYLYLGVDNFGNAKFKEAKNYKYIFNEFEINWLRHGLKDFDLIYKVEEVKNEQSNS